MASGRGCGRAIEFFVMPRHGFDVKVLFDAFTSGLPHATTEFRIGKNREDTVRQCRGIARRHEQTGGAGRDDFGRAADCSRDNRQTARRGFEQR